MARQNLPVTGKQDSDIMMDAQRAWQSRRHIAEPTDFDKVGHLGSDVENLGSQRTRLPGWLFDPTCPLTKCCDRSRCVGTGTLLWN